MTGVISTSPTVASVVSTLVIRWGMSGSQESRRMRPEFPDLRRHCRRANRLWSGSYFAGSVGGAPVSVLRQYIEQQNQPG
jgi:REP element-mobilizing transposase RayT